MKPGIVCRTTGIWAIHNPLTDFRHFFATPCIDAGVDITTVSRWLGHKGGGALAMRVSMGTYGRSTEIQSLRSALSTERRILESHCYAQERMSHNHSRVIPLTFNVKFRVTDSYIPLLCIAGLKYA